MMEGGTNGAGVIFKLARLNPPVPLVPSLVAPANTFQLLFTGVPMGQYEIQTGDQLPPFWQTITNVQASDNGRVQFLESIGTGTTSRIYRVLSR